jgi:hypothetical protein
MLSPSRQLGVGNPSPGNQPPGKSCALPAGLIDNELLG